MENNANKTFSVILPILHQIKQIRLQLALFKYLVFAFQILFFLNLPLRLSMGNLDETLKALAQIYLQCIINNKISVYVVSGLFFLFILIFFAFIGSLRKSSIDSSQTDSLGQKLRRFYIVAFVLFQIIILPSFVISVENVINNSVPELRAVSISIIPFAVILIGLEDERRLYQFSLIIIIFFRLFTSSFLTLLILTIFSIKRGRAQEKQLHKKIVYYEIGYWMFATLIVITLQQSVNYLYLILPIIAIAGLLISAPRDGQLSSTIQQNDKLILLAKKIAENQRINISQNIFINRCICACKQDAIKLLGLNSDQEAQILKNIQVNINQDEIINLIETKIEYQIKKQYSHLLRIQKLECDTKFKKFNLKILYDIEKLIEEVKLESTFEQKEKLYELVSVAESTFLKNETNLNARTVIDVERQLQQFYQCLINIAIVMQQFWNTHKSNNLNQSIINNMIAKVIELQKNAQMILSKISGLACTQREIIIFQYLKQMTDSSIKPKDQKIKQPTLNLSRKANANYILIEQNSILEMSNRLLNQLSLTKQEAKGYNLCNIVNQPLSKYLTTCLNELVGKQMSAERANFILPLRVSREQSYIQPFVASVEILPQLINGIKYILHLERNIDLEKPMLLYDGQTDQIIGITQNLSKHFDILDDSYIFDSYSSDIFNNSLQILDVEKQIEIIHSEFRIQSKSKKLQRIRDSPYIPVILRKVFTYQINQKQLILLSMNKKEQNEKQICYQTQDFIFGNVRPKTYDQEDKNQTLCKTFYKISNPFQKLVQQTITKINSSYRFSYLKLTIFIIAFLFITIASALIILQMQITKIQKNIMFDYNDSLLVKDKQIGYYQLYTQSAILYQLRKYPGHFDALSNYNKSALVQEYSSKINGNIRKILQEDIYNSLSRQKRISYDRISYAKQLIITNNISQLIKSWDQYKIQGFSGLFDQTIRYFNQFYTYFAYSTFASTGVIVFALLLIRYKLHSVLCELIQVYQQVDFSHSDQYAHQYKLFAHQIYSSKYFRGIKSNKYLKNFQYRSRMQNIDQIATITYLQDTLGIELQLDSITRNPKQSQIRISKGSILNTICKQIYVFLMLAFIVSFLCLFSYYGSNYRDDLVQIKDHLLLLHEAKGNININSATFMVSSLQQLFNASERRQYNLPNQLNLTLRFESPLPSFFSSYSTSEVLMINSNLCNFPLHYNDSLYKPMICSQILDGILKISLSQATVKYNKIVRQYLSTQMSQFGNTTRKGAKYPVFIEILYTGKTLHNLLSQIQKIFTTLSKVYITISNSILLYMAKLGWLLLPILIVLNYLFYNRQASKCIILLKFFFTLPREYLLQIKVSKLLKKKDILSYIQSLPF